jgi:hypothetical protein
MTYRLMSLGLRPQRADGPIERWWSRVAVVWLCAQLRGRRRHFHTVMAVTRVMCSSRDRWASRRAMRTLDELSAAPWFLRDVLGCFTGETQVLSLSGRRYVLTPTSVSFLLAPLPATVECSYVPRTRLVGFLSAAQLPYPAPVGTDHRDVASWFVDAAIETADERARAMVADVLSSTNQPDLLEALQFAFVRGADRMRPSGRA